MREIKFKGMDISGSWHVGNVSILIKNVGGVKSGTYISNSVGVPFAYDIRPETLSQYTGLKDKNGKEIYEGDIIIWNPDGREVESGQPKQVIWEGIGWDPFKGDMVDSWKSCRYEVIGNKFENPEFLK